MIHADLVCKQSGRFPKNMLPIFLFRHTLKLSSVNKKYTQFVKDREKESDTVGQKSESDK